MRAACQAGAVPKSTPETTERDREQQHRHVQLDHRLGRQHELRHQRHRPHHQEREPDADGAADERQHQALGQELPRDLDPRRAERRPHRHLALPRGAAREEQIGDVGAGDEQQEAHRENSSSEFFVAGLRKLLRNGSTLGVQPRLESGNSAACRSATSFSRALACSTVTPGFSRPSAVSAPRGRRRPPPV